MTKQNLENSNQVGTGLNCTCYPFVDSTQLTIVFLLTFDLLCLFWLCHLLSILVYGHVNFCSGCLNGQSTNHFSVDEELHSIAHRRWVLQSAIDDVPTDSIHKLIIVDVFFCQLLLHFKLSFDSKQPLQVCLFYQVLPNLCQLFVLLQF